MPVLKLTDLTVKALATEKGQEDFFDSVLPTFGVRVTSRGTKSFFVMYYQWGGKYRRTLGRYPKLGLSTARDLARDVMEKVESGVDPGSSRRQALTFGELANSYMELYAKVHKKSWREDERILAKDLLPRWRTRPVITIRRADVVELLDGVALRGPIMANRTRALVSKIFSDFDQQDDFRGVPMMYSWPSNGRASPTAYASDYDRALAEDRAFNHFLTLVKTDAGIDHVHVIAHSMGNLVVASALERRSPRPPQPIVSQLVLAAPDIPAPLFEQRFLQVLPELAERVTLYVSDQDKALILSSELRKGDPRAGQVEGGLLVASSTVKSFDGIDASDLPTDFLRHSYWANNESMLSDIYCLLKGAPPERRPLLLLTGAVWRFRPLNELKKLKAGDCAPPTFLQLISDPNSGKNTVFWIRVLIIVALAFPVVFFVLRRRARRTSV